LTKIDNESDANKNDMDVTAKTKGGYEPCRNTFSLLIFRIYLSGLFEIRLYNIWAISALVADITMDDNTQKAGLILKLIFCHAVV